MFGVRTSNAAWSLAGVVAGGAGLATSYLTANLMNIREAPVVAVAELVIRHTPGQVAEEGIDTLGHHDKPALVAGILVILTVVFAVAGWQARRRWWLATVLLVGIAVVGVVAVLSYKNTEITDAFPVLVGLATWLLVLFVLAERLRHIEVLPDSEAPTEDAPYPPLTVEQRHSRRAFLIGAGSVAVVAAVTGYVGRLAGRSRREVERARRLLRLDGVTKPSAPADAKVGVSGITPWVTPADDFYLIDTAVIVPTIKPEDWSIRIHGMVEKEVVLTFEDLVARDKTESWVTLNCVSNEVGGNLIGNAWWSGVRVADLLAEAGPSSDADAVLQTSDDGWTCGTPLEALTDDRDAMLAIAMNGDPLPIEHGFPVRTLVPGLYGYVSACKWVVDMEVTRFDKITAFWTDKGWSEMGPVKMSSRIDVPRNGHDVEAGSVTFAGIAWSQHTGISGVQVSVDDGDWHSAILAGVPSDDTWVQWKAMVEVEPGDHKVKVRAVDKTGLPQTGEEQDVLPDGSTGWHTIGFQAKG
jgi:DMSO/TMAO reductase YedYZ molybdopterin-dependent catalytic subunit